MKTPLLSANDLARYDDATLEGLIKKMEILCGGKMPPPTSKAHPTYESLVIERQRRANLKRPMRVIITEEN